MEKENSRTILILGPHPDDAEISMGGSIVAMLDKGWQVVLADLTNGEPTPNGTPEIRAAEAAKAAEILGVTKRVCLGLPNRYLTETLEHRKIVAECIREYKPHWIFTTALPDAHPDHIHAHALVQDARFAAKLTKTDMAFEPHWPKKLMYFFASHLRQNIIPSFVVDVSPYWDKKVAAIEAYQSQFALNQNEPDKKGWVIDHIESICRYFGSRIGVEYAEPFFCEDLVALGDFEGLL